MSSIMSHVHSDCGRTRGGRATVAQTRDPLLVRHTSRTLSRVGRARGPMDSDMVVVRCGRTAGERGGIGLVARVFRSCL